MLGSLLPGLRDLRTPLATGYVWLIAAYLAVYPLLQGQQEVSEAPSAITHLANAAGHAITGAAVSFGAYLLGILSVGLMRPLLTRTTRPNLIPLARSHLVGQPPRVLATDKAVSSLSVAVWSALRERIENDDLIRGEFLNRCEAVEAALKELREAGEARKHDTLGFTSAPEWEQAIRDGRRQTWAAGLQSLLPIRSYRDECVREIENVPPRLLGKEPELWGSWDRLRSEAEFRVSIAAPLGALIGVLCFRWSPLWVVGMAPILFLIYLGRIKSLEAVQLLAEAMAAKRVESAVLESIRKGGRIRWVNEIDWGDMFVIALSDDGSRAVVEPLFGGALQLAPKSTSTETDCSPGQDLPSTQT